MVVDEDDSLGQSASRRNVSDRNDNAFRRATCFSSPKGDTKEIRISVESNSLPLLWFLVEDREEIAVRAIDVANVFISKYGSEVVLSNLSLNKLVYFAQVESLRTRGIPLFDDRVEAWEYGPVEPSVYHAFKKYGSSRISIPSGMPAPDPSASKVISDTFEKYGKMTAFDLVELSHREGSAWGNTYSVGCDAEITSEAILASHDGVGNLEYSGTLASGIQQVNDRWPNTFKLLKDA